MHAINVRQQLAEQLHLCGYQWLDVDFVEQADLFLTRASAQIAQNLYMFEKNGTAFALRPEFTAAAMSHYIQHAYQEPMRWQFSGYIFQEQHGKPKQVLSAGIELLGDASTDADAEVMALATQALTHLGKTNWRITIGHVGLHRHILRQFGLSEFLSRALTNVSQGFTLEDMLPSAGNAKEVTYTDAPQTNQMLDVLLDSTRYGTTMGGRSRQDIVNGIISRNTQYLSEKTAAQLQSYLASWATFSSDIPNMYNLRELLPSGDEHTHALYEEWERIIQSLLAMGVDPQRITIQPNLAHSWDYYTGCVFSVVDEEGITLANGGRYDELGHIFGGVPVPATGFALHLEQMIASAPTSPTFCLIGEQNDALQTMASTLRENGIAVYTRSAPTTNTPNTLHCTPDGLWWQGKTYPQNDLTELMTQLRTYTTP